METGDGTGGYIFARRRTRFADTSLSVTQFNDIRLSLLTERRADGTARLLLRGRDLHDRYGARLADRDLLAVCSHVCGGALRLTHLDLSYNRITDAGFRTLLEYLLVRAGCGVTHLDVNSNELTVTSLEHLLKYAKTVSLTHLRLTGNKFGPGAGVLLARVLMVNATLAALDVCDTGLTLVAVAAVAAALRDDGGRNVSLRALDLGRVLPLSPLYPLETRWLAYHMELLLERNATLTELHLQKNALAGHDMEYVVRGLRGNRALLMLDVGYNAIGDCGAELLADYLRAGPRLRVLNVAGNAICDAGARALSFALPHSKVRALDVSDNRMTDGGVLDVLSTIKKPYFMQILNVWGNELGLESCTVMERMLRSGVLEAGALDVRLYGGEGAWRAARCSNAANRASSKHVYYNVMDYGYAQPVYHIRRDVAAEKQQQNIL